ncbi:NAD(P)-dependent oxidoreductase [Flavobacteriaceae bacterium]|nr:NAD(P)-dependent oxidoreductase [Flavobacteriaceae bacterium]
MKNSIVFGGSGFLGSHLADELINIGHNVTIFDLKKSQYLQQNQKMIVGDIMNVNDVENAVKGMDYVYHFAAIADIGKAKENVSESANFNIMGTINVLNACVKFKIERFVFSSTIYVYSDHGSFYRVSKQASELYIENFSKEYDLDYTILRYGSLYGTRANSFNFINSAIIQALSEGKIIRKGDGQETRDYINVKDAAKLTVEVLGQRYKNQHVMITGSQSLKVINMLEMIKEMMDNKVELVFNNESMDGHYKLTPYSFKPKVALKITPKDFHDIGQGILECIYEVNSTIIKK